MIDDVKRFFINDEQKMPKIKGHAKIILTNVNTGEKKIVERDNTFQSAFLTKYLRSMGLANISPWRNSNFASNSLWRNLVGGILLFRDEITAPAEYMTAGNLMIGNGAIDVTNAGTPTELGSYNSVESSTSGSNSLSFVYDWNTSQANGTIGCVCLTTEAGGYIGYGNASGDAVSSPRVFDFRQEVSNSFARTAQAKNGFRYGVSSIDTTNKKITIRKRVDQMTQASLFYEQNDVDTEFTYTGDIVTGGDSRLMAKPLDEDRIVCVKGSNATIANGATGRVLIYNISTNTVSAFEFNNTSGETLRITTTSSGNNSILIAFDGTNYYGVTSGNKLAKFDNTGAFVEFVGIANPNTPVMGRIAPGIVTSGALRSGNEGTVYFYDGVSQKITNAKQADSLKNIEYIDGFDLLAYIDEQSARFIHNPMMLSTINNLDSPVTKDSTQTMKIIYTLTEASS